MPKLMWLDLETTGLSPTKQHVLEVALWVADLNAPFDAAPAYQSVVYFPRTRWGELGPVVLEMHTKNGLLEDCSRASAPLIEHVEQQLLTYVPLEKERDDKPILAGSTIHFDHSFVEVHLPKVHARLSYRHYDVSGLKLFCQSMGMPKFRKAEVHRADADIAESISHGAECEQWLRNNMRPR